MSVRIEPVESEDAVVGDETDASSLWKAYWHVTHVRKQREAARRANAAKPKPTRPPANPPNAAKPKPTRPPANPPNYVRIPNLPKAADDDELGAAEIRRIYNAQVAARESLPEPRRSQELNRLLDWRDQQLDDSTGAAAARVFSTLPALNIKV